MRFMVFVKLSDPSGYEAGQMPNEDEIISMMKFNEELVQAGVMLSGDGLAPTSQGAMVRFAGGASTITTGPYTETTELIGGYWIWQVGSRDEAIAWARKCPMADGDALELRRIFDMEDFDIEPGSEIEAQFARIESALTS